MQDVQWGEWKLGDLFEIKSYKKRFDANKVTVVEKGGHPYIVRQSTDNGKKGNIDESAEWLNPGNTISFGQDTATMFYQEESYFTGDKIKILCPKYSRFGKDNAQFFLACMRKTFHAFAWGSSRFNIQTLSAQIVRLPMKADGSVDFDFMESFIAELEAERLAELEAYLKVTGLSDCELTEAEEKALEEYREHTISMADYTLEEIFDHIAQGRRLKKDDQRPGDIPFVMSGVTNTGVVGYISNPVASFPKNSITVDIFGNSFYRDYDFGAGDDTGVYWNSQISYSKLTMLYFTATIGKFLSGKFSYGNKLRSSQSLDFKIKLPVKDGKPDYEWMDTFISAIQKKVIKNVVRYADQKIQATKDVITKGNAPQYPTLSFACDLAADTVEKA